MKIEGFKGFNKDKTNRYGVPFEEGKKYHVDGPIRFGNNGNGFHLATHLSDVFRFFDPEDVSVARVIGSGEYKEGEYDDWDQPYYGMYAVSDIEIVKFLTREEIIDIMTNASASDVIKFYATFNPTDEEALRILKGNADKYDHDRARMAYLYYLKNIDIYSLPWDEGYKMLKKVLGNGQDSNQRGKRK